MSGLDRESTRRSAKAGDLTLNYYEAGEPTSVGGGLPLVMLHGGGPGASAWSNFGSALPGFAEDFRTLLIDQPGFGQSDKPPVEGNYFRFAAEASRTCSTSSASNASTCSATAWAAAPRRGSPCSTRSGSAGSC